MKLLQPMTSLISLALILVACSAPPVTETVVPLDTPSPSVIPETLTPPLETSTPDPLLSQKAREALAKKLGLPIENIALVGVDSVEWPDDCLAIYVPGQACTEAVILGYQITLKAENVVYEYRSNQDGSLLLFAGPLLGSKTFPVLVYRLEGGIAGLCDSIEIYAHGKVTFQSCRNQQTIFNLTDPQLRQILAWINHYQTYESLQSNGTATDQITVTLIFDGNGSENIPDEIHQQMQHLAEQLLASVHEQTAFSLPYPAPTETRSPEQLDPVLAGLLLTSPEGLWRVESDGWPRLLFDRQEVVLSPDGEQVVYLEDNDLWIVKLSTGETVNLTNTPDRAEYLPLWSSARPDRLFFISYPVEMEIAISLMGFLTMVNVDGSGYRILDEEIPYSYQDLSPDGDTVAYGQGETAWLYHLDTDQSEAFIPSEYGLPDIKTIVSPSWSPDGKGLAWVVHSEFIGVDLYGIAIFDLETHSARVLHPYRPCGGDVYPGPGSWSPDGNWFAYLVCDEDIFRSGVWVFSISGVEEILIQGGSSFWKPDGSYLFISNLNGEGPAILEVDSWFPTPIILPEQIRNIMDWR